MLEAKEKGTVNCNVEITWEFIKNLKNWAHCMPGFVSYQELDEDKSLWCLRGDSKILKKKKELIINVTERTKPDRITFTLESAKEGIKGKGTYEAIALSEDMTNVEFTLELYGQGLAKKLVDAYLKNTLSRDCKVLKDNVIRLLEENRY